MEVKPSQARHAGQSKPLYQIHDAHTEGIGDDLQRLNRDVALAALDLAHVRPVQAGFIGEHVLRPALFQAQPPHRRPDRFLDILHQKQFEATLVLRILVITSGAIFRAE